MKGKLLPGKPGGLVNEFATDVHGIAPQRGRLRRLAARLRPSPERRRSMRASNERWLRNPLTAALLASGAGTLLCAWGVGLAGRSAWAPLAGRAADIQMLGATASATGAAMAVLGWRWVAPPREGRYLRDRADDVATMAGAVALAAMNILNVDATRAFVVEFSTAAAAEARVPLLRPLPDGSGVLMGATMVRGSTDRLREILDANPSARTLYLFGPGGSRDEGLDMGALVRTRGLRTVALPTCASACTLAYLSGRPRLVAGGGEAPLGFHAGSYLDGDMRMRADDPVMLLAYLAAGLKPSFVDRAVSTPFDRLWTPAVPELLAANAADGVLEPGEVPGLRWVSSVPGKVPDPYLTDGWLPSYLGRAMPAALADLRAWTQASWALGRNDGMVEHLRRRAVGRMLASALSRSDRATLRDAAARMAAGLATGGLDGAACADLSRRADVAGIPGAGSWQGPPVPAPAPDVAAAGLAAAALPDPASGATWRVPPAADPDPDACAREAAWWSSAPLGPGGEATLRRRFGDAALPPPPVSVPR